MSNKTKVRFNGIDLLIIIVFIGCLIGLALRYQVVDAIKNAGDVQSAEISFYLSDIKETSEECFAQGDVFYITSTGDRLGELKGGFVFEPAEDFNMTSSGEYVKSASATGRSDMRGVIEGKGIFSNEGFLLNNSKYIAPGSEIAIQSGKISVTVTVTNIVHVS
ncbi:MAG: DUF4330 family protein [Ruminococcaceae bacterium]|nr:DUF4330 family protein [Oscillospiraceae bacterium]